MRRPRAARRAGAPRSWPASSSPPSAGDRRRTARRPGPPGRRRLAEQFGGFDARRHGPTGSSSPTTSRTSSRSRRRCSRPRCRRRSATLHLGPVGLRPRQRRLSRQPPRQPARRWSRQSNPEARDVPPYPVRAEAFYPAGPPEASQAIATAARSDGARPSDRSVDAITTMSGADLPQFIDVGAITTSAQSARRGRQVDEPVADRADRRRPAASALSAHRLGRHRPRRRPATATASASDGGTTVVRRHVPRASTRRSVPTASRLQEPSQRGRVGPLTPSRRTCPTSPRSSIRSARPSIRSTGAHRRAARRAGRRASNELLAAAGIHMSAARARSRRIDGSARPAHRQRARHRASTTTAGRQPARPAAGR